MVGESCRSSGGDSSKQLAKVCEGPERTARDRTSLLDLIHGFYKAAPVRLPLQEMPELKGGLCFGFMDPVSNIIVNTVSYRHPPTGIGARKRKRRERSAKAWRKAILSRIVTDISNVSSSGPEPTLLPTVSIAVRSLQSLVAFLVCNFCYLFTATALEYLLLAKGQGRPAHRRAADPAGP
ncbi:hypothetical protein BRADI_2g12395v3 [Brachypodium distachyon]|uniref:PIR2-like helical domain-containing protein n=1 Tax=Brachypodium distachyon TaxID=15368 RepID=A0A2K2D848_BRADI|nr:hypothetical protein BRADI_2g12395v3 [Brachypodium distachyon]